MIQPMYRQQQKELIRKEICEEILVNSRNELYLSMRFLDVALSALEFVEDPGISLTATDGFALHYHGEELIQLYRTDRKLVNRAYLHMIIHCLFAHMYMEKGREEELWNLACDMGAEYILDGLYIPCVHRRGSPLRRKTYHSLKENMKVVTAQGIYHWLLKQSLDHGEKEALKREFLVDDHSLWKQDIPPKEHQMRQRKWKDMSEKMQTEMETFSKEGVQDSRSLYEQISVENRERYDYREFLRKFSVLKEEMKVDMDSFDYIFYNYGMELYGNMPLIEPLETMEIHRIEEFVIVIDTSMSCKGDTVRHFLEETYTILSQQESFSRRIHIHVIQCDEKVQQDTVITEKEQLKAYMDNFRIVGEGGTDFRPAFAYVNELVAKGAFHRLRGLIYFTDGYGIYPAGKPDYDTAFVFMKDDYRDVDVPPWAMKLIIDENELET